MIKTFITIAVIVLFFVGAFTFFQNQESAPQEEVKEPLAEEVLEPPESQDQDEEVATSTETPIEMPEEEPLMEEKTSTSNEVSLQEKNMIQVTIKTEKGDIKLELYPKVAPKTVDNFVKLSNEGFYNGVKFHRVISGFMIQGGDPLSKTDDPRVGSGGPGYSFEDEINPRSLGLSDGEIEQLEAQGYVYDYILESMTVDVGTIAMANSGPNTNGSQFFIVTESLQAHLNGKHTVFGKVIEGMDVVLSVEQGDVINVINISD